MKAWLSLCSFAFAIGFVHAGQILHVDYTVALDAPFTVPNTTPATTRFYDAITPIMPNPDNPRQLLWFWAGRHNYRIIVDDDNVDDILNTSYTAVPKTEVFPFYPPMLNGQNIGDNKGGWLNFIYRIPDGAPVHSGRMVAIYHAEDNDFVNGPDGNTAWMGVMRAYSDDEGISWNVSKREQIISAHAPKPDTAAYGGCAQHGVFYDATSGYYYCYYREGRIIGVARSSDIMASAGTWTKYYNGSWSEPGLRGRSSVVPGLKGFNGGDPSVTYSEYLQCYVMILKSGGGSGPSSLYITTSQDLLNWEAPKVLLKNQSGEVYRYPTIIGSTASLGTTNMRMDETCWLSYQYRPAVGRKPSRRFQKLAFNLLSVEH